MFYMNSFGGIFLVVAQKVCLFNLCF